MLVALVQVRQAPVVQQVPERVLQALVLEQVLEPVELVQVVLVQELALVPAREQVQALDPDQAQTGNHPEIRNTESPFIRKRAFFKPLLPFIPFIPFISASSGCERR